MYSNEVISEINRLSYEEMLWIIFAVLSILNVIGDENSKEFIKTNNQKFEKKSDEIFEVTLIVTLFIYIYFFSRNSKALEQASSKDKELYSIKVLGSLFLIAGIICLIYFQTKQTSFIGSPAI